MATNTAPAHGVAGLYAVYSKESLALPDKAEGSHDTLPKALKALKTLRNDLTDGFIVPRDAKERVAYPYRNKIGPLRDDISNHWGYKLRVPNMWNVASLWIEKQTPVPTGATNLNRTLKDDLEASEEIKDAVEDLDIEYIAEGAKVNARFDEEIQDFIFEEEEGVRSGRNQHNEAEGAEDAEVELLGSPASSVTDP